MHANDRLARICDFSAHQSAITELRHEVFVEEQHVPRALELDGLDPACKHAVIFRNERLIGTGRLTPSGQIGRVAIAADYRRQGYGRQLMVLLEQQAQKQGFQVATLSAQINVLAFYLGLGYQIAGPTFIDADIEHLPMYRVLNS